MGYIKFSYRFALFKKRILLLVLLLIAYLCSFINRDKRQKAEFIGRPWPVRKKSCPATLSFKPVKKMPRPKAVIVLLCRNSDLHGALTSITSFEKYINHKLKYPYVLLNDKNFTSEFKNSVTHHLNALGQSAGIEFAKIPSEDWSYPPYINETRAAQSLQENAGKYIYGSSKSYRFMIRYFSGPFFSHPSLLPYDYYWRREAFAKIQ